MFKEKFYPIISVTIISPSGIEHETVPYGQGHEDIEVAWAEGEALNGKVVKHTECETHITRFNKQVQKLFTKE